MKKQFLTIGIVLVYLIGATFIISCSNEGAQKSEQSEHVESDGHDNSDGHSHEHSSNTEKTIIKEDFKGEKVKNLSLIIDGYLALKNDLAADNSEKAAQSGSKLLMAFDGFDKSSLADTQTNEYAEIEESAVENTEHIIKNEDEIDHQREHLVSLSEDISDLIALVGTDKKLYEDFCPMANNKKGAIWISESKEIRNPYMGSKMPTCGKIQREIN